MEQPRVVDWNPGGGPALLREPAPSPESRRVAGALADLGHAVVVATGPSSAGGSGSRSASRFGSRSASPAVLARLLPGVRGVVPLPDLPPAVPPRDWAEVPPWWRRPARQLAYLLAADWPALGMTGSAPPRLQSRSDPNLQARPPKRVAAAAT